MNFLMGLGVFLVVISAPQMLPSFRRRAAERGLSNSIAIPLFLTFAGILTALVGLALKPHM